MDDAQFTDLKQFFAASLSQALADVATKDDIASLKNELEAAIHDLNVKVDILADALAENLDNHERRSTKLELQAA